MISSKKLLLLSATALTALSLTSCSGGGGGGSAGPIAPPPVQQSAPPPTSSPTPPATTSGLDVYLGPQATNIFPTFNQYTPTGVLTVLKAGVLSGSGVSIGVMDSGVNTGVASLNGRVTWFNSYVANGNSTPLQNNISSANDPYGHGTVVTALLAGFQQGTYGNNNGPVNFFPGGVAPGATIYSAQLCDSSGNCTIYSKAYQDLTSLGVHLYNNSIAENASTYSSASAAATASQQVGTEFSGISPQNVYVWAAGNNPANPNDISVEAEAPVYTPSLQPQWLSVVNVDIGSNGQVTGLDTTSDACGVTAQWCLAAPGNDQVPIVAGSTFNTGYAVGTSLAAPIVTGTLALIWQKYPWMVPANLTDTILTTATPIGGQTGPNSTYGWGLVNAAAAVNGPAQFAFGDFAANIGAYQSTFSNPIAGSGSLTLSGSTGTLTLAADNTYTGGTTVNGGNLALTGSVASAVTVNGGSFGGPGVVNGNVTNNTGTVVSQGATGGAAGLTINGNYTAGSGANTAISIGTPLTVSGTATLAGNVQVLAPPTAYTPHSTETFIQAGSVGGTFASQSYGAGVFYTISNFVYGPTTVTATVTASNVAQAASALPGSTAATVAGGAALQSTLQAAIDSPTKASTAGSKLFLTDAGQALAAKTAAQAKTILTSVSGEAYPTMRVISASEDLSILDMAAQHIAAQPPLLKTSTWFEYLGDFGSLRQKNADAVQYSSNGFMAGFNTHAMKNLSVGGAFAHLAYTGSLDGVGGMGNDSLNNADLYARYGAATGFYGSGQIAYGWVNGHAQRTIDTATSSSGVEGMISDHIVAEAAEMGYQVDGLNPYVSLTDIQYHGGAVVETGGNGLGLSVAAQNATYAFTTAGVRASEVLPIFGHVIAVQGTLGWQHKISGANTMLASFTDMPSTEFPLVGQHMPRNEALMGVNFAGNLTGNWMWSAGWMGSFDGQSMSNAVNAGVKVSF
jgi:autotransporter-associated beta strand protein